jgi:hypothetical protein
MRVMRNHVIDVHVDALCRPTGLGGGLHFHLVRLRRTDHHHATPVTELGVRDAAFRSRHDHLFLEAEHGGEPLERGGRVLVPQEGKNTRRCVAHVS